MSFEDDFAAFTGTGEGSYLAECNRILEEANKRLPAHEDGIWEVYDEAMAPDFLLSCPCGSVIELDGMCPRGHRSPLRGSGMI